METIHAKEEPSSVTFADALAMVEAPVAVAA